MAKTYYIRRVREIRDLYEIYETPAPKPQQYILEDGERVCQIPSESTRTEVLEEFRPMSEMEVILFKEKGFD